MVISSVLPMLSVDECLKTISEIILILGKEDKESTCKRVLEIWAGTLVSYYKGKCDTLQKM
jgi:hypothetical protein